MKAVAKNNKEVAVGHVMDPLVIQQLEDEVKIFLSLS